MLRNKPVLLLSTAAFLAVETFLGLLMHLSTGRTVPVAQFSAIVLACLFCFLFLERKPAYQLTQFALLCTVGADYFLVLAAERAQLPGMMCFALAQTAYFLRLFLDDPVRIRRIIHLVIRGVLTVVVTVVTVIVLGDSVDTLAVVSMFYYTNLIVNLIFAFVRFRSQWLMALGFLLFLLCYTLIGLAFIDPYFTIPADSFIHTLIYPGFDLAWAFYLPSQMLLAVSLLPNRLKTLRSEGS